MAALSVSNHVSRTVPGCPIRPHSRTSAQRAEPRWSGGGGDAEPPPIRVESRRLAESGQHLAGQAVRPPQPLRVSNGLSRRSARMITNVILKADMKPSVPDARSAPTAPPRNSAFGRLLAFAPLGLVWPRRLRASGPVVAFRPALAELHRRATGGDPGAQLDLGLRYVTGKGIPPDEPAALRWIGKAASQGKRRRPIRAGQPPHFGTAPGLRARGRLAAKIRAPRFRAGPNRPGECSTWPARAYPKTGLKPTPGSAWPPPEASAMPSGWKPIFGWKLERRGAGEGARTGTVARRQAAFFVFLKTKSLIYMTVDLASSRFFAGQAG